MFIGRVQQYNEKKIRLVAALSLIEPQNLLNNLVILRHIVVLFYCFTYCEIVAHLVFHNAMSIMTQKTPFLLTT